MLTNKEFKVKHHMHWPYGWMLATLHWHLPIFKIKGPVRVSYSEE